MSHELKDHGVAEFVTPLGGPDSSEELKRELSAHVVKRIGAITRPDDIVFAGDLPKARSGNIMRCLPQRHRRRRALGETTTLAAPGLMARLKIECESREG